MEQLAPRTSQPEPAAYRFGGHTLDPARGVLRDTRGSEAELRPKTAEVLRHLADKAGRVVSREELMQAVWPDVAVTDDSLTQCVFEIRRALGEEGARLLRTLPKRGYLLAAAVTRAEAPASPATTTSRDAAATWSGRCSTVLAMGEKQIERRLAAILAADVAGYSRLMGTDEEGTHVRLMAHRREFIEPGVARYHGRIVKNTGDGLLAEFASVVDAVRCAVTVQRGMAERNSSLPPSNRIVFRIGINLGDVIVERDDIHGDDVNIAARLEGIAEPGSVCLSQAAYEQVKGKFDLGARDMGEQRLKNIAEPVRTYSIPLAAEAARVGARLAPAPPTTREPRLSVVVLPFANLSGDPEQDYFVDGLTEDLTSELSRQPDFFVIARSTAFTYKGSSNDVKKIARELGVRYVLEGSVRRAGNRVRVTARLIEAETTSTRWSERFDRELSDVFALQDTIALELAHVLGIKVVEAESRRSARSSDPDVLDLMLRARAAFNRAASLENYSKAQRLYEEALRAAPGEPRALTGLSVVLVANLANQWSKQRGEDLRRAEALAAQAMALELEDPWCHFALGMVRRLQSRFGEARSHFEAAIRLNPSLHAAHAQLGWVKAFSGRAEEAATHFAEYIRLSPRDPKLFSGLFGVGWTRFLLGDDDAAIEALHEAIALNPHYSPSHLCLAAAYGMQGRIDAAETALAAYVRTGTPANTIALLREGGLSNHPIYVAQRERLYEGLRRAGMPA